MKPFFNPLAESDGEGRKEMGKGRDRRWSAGEFHVQNQPQFGNYLHDIISFFLFFSPWVMLAHPLVLLRGAFSCGVCANPLLKKRQTPFITKVGANISCHKPNVLDRTALFWGARGHTSLISSLLLSLAFLLHSATPVTSDSTIFRVFRLSVIATSQSKTQQHAKDTLHACLHYSLHFDAIISILGG